MPTWSKDASRYYRMHSRLSVCVESSGAILESRTIPLRTIVIISHELILDDDDIS